MRAARVFGLLVLLVQVSSVLAFGLSVYTIFNVASSTASEGAIGLELTIDRSTGIGVLRLRATPRNAGPLGVDLAIGVGAIDDSGVYITRNSTSMHLDAGEGKPVSLSLRIPGDLMQEMTLKGVEGYFEVTFDIRTLNKMVGVLNTMRIQAGEPR